MKKLQQVVNNSMNLIVMLFCGLGLIGCQGTSKEAPPAKKEGEYSILQDRDGRYEPFRTPYINPQTFFCTVKQTDLIHSTVKVIDRHRAAQLHELARENPERTKQITFNRGFELDRYLDFDQFGLSPSIAEAAQAQRWALEFTDACEQVIPCKPNNKEDEKLQQKMYAYCSSASMFAFVSHHRRGYNVTTGIEYVPIKNFENFRQGEYFGYELYYRIFQLGMPLYLKEHDYKTARNLSYLCHIRDDLFGRLDPEQKFYKRQPDEEESCKIIRNDYQELRQKQKVQQPIGSNGVCDDQFLFYYNLIETSYENYKREEAHFGKGKTLDTLYYGQALDVLRETCGSIYENFPTMECKESAQPASRILSTINTAAMCEITKGEKRKYPYP